MVSDGYCGVVASFLANDGTRIAEADFDTTHLFGFSLLESQKHRVRDALDVSIMRTYCNHDFVQCLNFLTVKSCVDSLVKNNFGKIEYIYIGHENGK